MAAKSRNRLRVKISDAMVAIQCRIFVLDEKENCFQVIYGSLFFFEFQKKHSLRNVQDKKNKLYLKSKTPIKFHKS